MGNWQFFDIKQIKNKDRLQAHWIHAIILVQQHVKQQTVPKNAQS